MSYQSLARKYRPLTFSELVGQEAVVKAIGNAIQLGREPHCVIFSGVRGIGKTTLARLYAKALNCEKGPIAEPCNSCRSCLAVTDGNHEDVLEIDGASNTGVDDIRSLQETIAYIPQRSRFKVYIIDEVHMLSQNAFNALLKTLEEPPSHVVFMFATTELAKLPDTVIGRCTTFHLQLLSIGKIIERIKVILATENIVYEDSVLVTVANEGHGSMRDALTFLDQIVALTGGILKADQLEGLIIRPSSEGYISLLSAMVKKDASKVLSIIEEWDQKGIDLIKAVEETAKFCRHAFIVRCIGAKALETTSLGLEAEVLGKVEDLAIKAEEFDLNRIFRTLVKCRSELDSSSLDRYVVENYMIEWCMDPGIPPIEEMLNALTGPRDGRAPISPTSLADNCKKAPIVDNNKKNEINHTPFSDRSDLRRVSDTINESRNLVEPGTLKAGNHLTFPSDWRELVNLWKKKKPLQARKIEEAYLVEYSKNQIVLEVNRASLAGGELLKVEFQQKIRAQFEEMFGFKGQLQVKIRDIENTQSPQPDAPIINADDKESLLDLSRKEKERHKQKLLTELNSNASTSDALAIFGGSVKNIELS